MTFIWLIVWLLLHTPKVEVLGAWNTWGIALAVCMFIDITGALAGRSWRRRAYLTNSADPAK
ncbi:MAG: hypothetical protein E6I70_01495 [Chloroflexi bacterium]|nr:MAG: hypothetical protein E6I70_01495 [Chloroflexota bacterium]